MRKVINLTQHLATKEQFSAGVFEPDPSQKEVVKNLLTFTSQPSTSDIQEVAKKLATVANFHFEIEEKAALIGGAPYLMSALEVELKKKGIKPLYSFSERISEEVLQEDGSVKKVNSFKHKGFIEV